MAFQVSSVTASIQNATNKTNRRLADFHPSIWGLHFQSYATDSTDTNDKLLAQQLQELKEEVKRMVMAATKNPSQQLDFIDAIQRLGVSYHFESEIDEIFQKLHNNPPSYNVDDDLYIIALWFRLVRQHGYHISSDIFNNFKDDKGNFKASLVSDVSGLLSLYEAAHLLIHGEDILDEALAFTTINLQSAMSHVSPQLAKKVTHALDWPIRRELPRLHAIHYISIYEEEELRNKTLLKFAKLDFNVLQAGHQKEISAISKWWANVDFPTKLPYARDRVVECYFWILGVYYEPKYSLARMILTKVTNMVSILDDTFDAYGTYEELKPFTEAVTRWDINAIDVLPDYMKLIYRTLLDVYNEIEADIAVEGRSHTVKYSRESMIKLVQAYLFEAQWCHEGYVPTMEEYMRVALATCAYSILATTSFVGMGEIATIEAFEWVSNDPKIVRASTVICRLMDDIKSHKFEQKRGHVASGVECYMKQHGVSELEEVYAVFRKEVENAWKDANEDCLKPTAVAMPLIDRVLNLTRVVHVTYKDGDGYTHSHLLKGFIASLLVDPMVI